MNEFTICDRHFWKIQEQMDLAEEKDKATYLLALEEIMAIKNDLFRMKSDMLARNPHNQPLLINAAITVPDIELETISKIFFKEQIIKSLAEELTEGMKEGRIPLLIEREEVNIGFTRFKGTLAIIPCYDYQEIKKE